MWMVISVLISPLLAYIILAVSESDDVRTCPFCAEKIKAQARVCRHCHHDSPRLGEGLMPATFKEVFSMTWKIVVSLIIVCYRLVGLRRANRSQSADNKTTNVSSVGRLSDKLLLAFEYDCPGNTSCVSDYVIGVFFTGSPSAYADSHEIVFLADGDRLQATRSSGTRLARMKKSYSVSQRLAFRG